MSDAPRVLSRCPVCAKELPFAGQFCSFCGAAISSVSQMPTGTVSAPEAAAKPAALAQSPAVGRVISSDSIPVGGFTPGAVVAERYRIIGLLGRGGMGEVYRADDLKLGQPVALKFLPRALSDDPVRRERFIAEVRIARQVSHPNICRVYDIGELQNQHFLSMEYIDGEDLASLLKRIGHLHSEKALDIARQLCAGLAAAHDKGVLHRDLKPANVMIDGRGRVRITDFGLALAAGEESPAGEISGTPAYMAPEQLAGKGSSVRSDIYALGLVLYELYTGKKAFQAPTLAELRAKKESETPAAPSEITRDMDPVVERVILRCIEKDPRGRPASAAQVAAALPGGDPLAAALAAGETPSPEMVAASGTKEGLRPAVAWGLLALIAAASVAAILMNQRTMLVRRAKFEKPPEVLVERAREFLRKAGYAGAADSAYGFETNPDFFRYVGQDDRIRGRPEYLEAGAMEFWYRQSPRPLERMNFMLVLDKAAPESNDPPLRYSGEALVRLDLGGRLRSFRAIPPQREPSGASTSPPPDWALLFAEAGLDRAQWTPAEPEWNPISYADSRAAWLGRLPQIPDASMRIEAASYRGRAVSFEVIGPWTRASQMTPSEPHSGEKIAIAFWILTFLVSIGGGLFFAGRNLRLGRGDRRGAARLVALNFCLMLVCWPFWEHHVATNWEGALLMMYLCFVLFATAVLWILYIALEPFVRRRWPQILVSWARLLSGEWRDPLVGRDVLWGCVAGAGVACLSVITAVFTLRLGYPEAATPAWLLDPLHGMGISIAVVGATPLLSVGQGLMWLFLLFFLRVLLRNEWLAAAGWVLLHGLPVFFVIGAPVIAGPAVLAIAIINLAVLRRLGLVSQTAFILFLRFPMTFDTSAWYFGIGLTGLFVFSALALYGFRASLGGRPLFAASSFED